MEWFRIVRIPWYPLVRSCERRRAAPTPKKPFLERMLDGIETLGNKMPDPAILFLVLCGGVIVVSQILYWVDVKATYEVVKPPPVPTEETWYGGSSEPTTSGRRSRCKPTSTRS